MGAAWVHILHVCVEGGGPASPLPPQNLGGDEKLSGDGLAGNDLGAAPPRPPRLPRSGKSKRYSDELCLKPLPAWPMWIHRRSPGHTGELFPEAMLWKPSSPYPLVKGERLYSRDF